MKISNRNRRDDDLDINVTSFIDVLLLLLIFFMLATSFVSDGRINIRLPDASRNTANKASESPLQILISASGDYSVNGQALVNNAANTLLDALKKVAGESREQTVLIRADANTSHQSVVTVMDVVGRLGFKSISIATVNHPESQLESSQ